MATDEKETLQRFVDALFGIRKSVRRLDAVLLAEAIDLPTDLIGIVNLLPPGDYSRQRMCDQFNSALKGHGWNGRFGTVE